MDQWTRLDPIYDSEAAARTIAAAAAARADAQDHDGGFPQDDVADLARLGLLAAPVPVEKGGAGLGTEPGAGALAEVLRLVGYGSLALGRLYEGHVNAIQLIARYGTPDQRSRLFADARAGHLFGVWNTEPAEGGLRVEARDTDGQLLGVKTFASGAGYVTRALVTARHPDRAGVAMMVVPLEAGTRADLSAWRAQGMRASATGTVDFTGLAVNAGDILGQPDDYFQQPAFEAVFDAWRGHLNRTGRGGDPHQLARLGEGAIAVEGARLWIERGAQVASDAGMPPARVVAYINLVRLAVERAGLDVLQLAQRSVGLQGFMRGHRLERLARDLATYLRQPGPDHALTAAASEILQADAMAGDLWTETAA